MPRKDIPNSKMYQATLPLALHEHLCREAEVAAQSGGHININKVLVQRLYVSLKDQLSVAARKEVESFIQRL